jgi:hypothetical protein
MKKPECLIDLEEIKPDNNNVVFLKCLHYYHKRCLEEWGNKSEKLNCP